MIEILTKTRQAGGTIEVVGGDLRFRLPKGLLSSAKRERKPEIVKLLADDQVVETQVENTTDSTVEPVVGEHLDQDAGGWETAVDPPAPCRQCGSLELWQDFADSWHCQICDPPIRSERLRATAARLRRQAQLTRAIRSNMSTFST